MASEKAGTVNRTFAIPIDIDDRFRCAVGERKGIGKGALSEALTEALKLWLSGAPKKEGGEDGQSH